MSTKEIPNPFEKIPKHEVAAWLEHPATRVAIASVGAIRCLANLAVLNAAAAQEVSLVEVARANGRTMASVEAAEIFTKAEQHVERE